jgi:hypothetical protein
MNYMNEQEEHDKEVVPLNGNQGKPTRKILSVLIVLVICLIFVSFPQFEILYYLLLSVTIYILIIMLSVSYLHEKGAGTRKFIVWSIIALFITLFILAIAIPQLLNTRGYAWENSCKLTLRALGSTQLSFADSHDGNFGTWEELVESGDIGEGCNRSNVINNYSIAVFDVKKAGISSFTIVAVPVEERRALGKPLIFICPRKNFPGIDIRFRDVPGWFLRVFAIGEDQTPRVWIGSNSEWTTENVSLHNIELWEPLR